MPIKVTAVDGKTYTLTGVNSVNEVRDLIDSNEWIPVTDTDGGTSQLRPSAIVTYGQRSV